MLISDRPTITDTAVESLHQAAEQLQQHYLSEKGYCYPLEDLLGALVKWMEGTIEDMANDAVFHAVEGRDDYAFNRRGFQRAMQQLTQKSHATL